VRREKEQGKREKGQLLLFLTAFVVLATANSAGYRYGASDQAFYAPAVMQWLDPELFPRDSRLLHAQSDLTFADETIGAIARFSRLDLPSLFVVLYVLTLGVLAVAVLGIGHVMYRERWTSLALLAAISLRHSIPKSGTNTLEGYFHPRQLAFACGALAVWAFLERRYGPLLLCLAIAAALHPTTTLWFVAWLYVAILVAEPRWRVRLTVIPIALIPVAWWAFVSGPLSGRLVRMDTEWLAALGEKDYLFPLEWPWYVWAVHLGYVVALLLAWRARGSAGVLRSRETALVAGCVSLVALFAIALVFQSQQLALSVQLQPARVFWMLDVLATIFVVWWIAESGARERHPRRAVALLVFLTVFSVTRGAYIMKYEFPERPLAQIGIRDDDWGRVMEWARGSDRRSGWLAHPLHAARYGTSVRVAGGRDVFVEPLKDSALGMYDRDVAISTRDRTSELQDFETMSAGRARRLATTYNLEFLVTDSTLDLPIAFQSGALRVYRIN
jgi:hypothetical protein